MIPILMSNFFAKYVFNGYDEGRLFLGGHVGHSFGPWERFPKNEGGFPKMRGDFML